MAVDAASLRGTTQESKGSQGSPVLPISQEYQDYSDNSNSDSGIELSDRMINAETDSDLLSQTKLNLSKILMRRSFLNEATTKLFIQCRDSIVSLLSRLKKDSHQDSRAAIQSAGAGMDFPLPNNTIESKRKVEQQVGRTLKIEVKDEFEVSNAVDNPMTPKGSANANTAPPSPQTFGNTREHHFDFIIPQTQGFQNPQNAQNLQARTQNPRTVQAVQGPQLPQQPQKHIHEPSNANGKANANQSGKIFPSSNQRIQPPQPPQSPQPQPQPVNKLRGAGQRRTTQCSKRDALTLLILETDAELIRLGRQLNETELSAIRQKFYYWEKPTPAPSMVTIVAETHDFSQLESAIDNNETSLQLMQKLARVKTKWDALKRELSAEKELRIVTEDKLKKAKELIHSLEGRVAGLQSTLVACRKELHSTSVAHRTACGETEILRGLLSKK